MRDYRLLIFDWDGTLVDSIGRIVSAMHAAADELDLAQRSDEAVKAIIGLGLGEAIVALYPELVESACVERFRVAYGEHYLALDAEPSPFFPGVEAVLPDLRARGYQLAVATGKGRRGLQRVLEAHGWQDFFDVTRCADETASKPDPLMLREILAHCGVPPRQALMVGDSAFDLLMAGRAGVDAVAVGYGAQPLTALRAHGPRWAINDFMELSARLAQAADGARDEVVEHVG